MDLDTVIATYLDHLAARNRLPGELLTTAPTRSRYSARPPAQLSDRYSSPS
jgi:hypothetical protein